MGWTGSGSTFLFRFREGRRRAGLQLDINIENYNPPLVLDIDSCLYISSTTEYPRPTAPDHQHSQPTLHHTDINTQQQWSTLYVEHHSSLRPTPLGILHVASSGKSPKMVMKMQPLIPGSQDRLGPSLTIFAGPPRPTRSPHHLRSARLLCSH
jgi:hypothetical protein